MSGNLLENLGKRGEKILSENLVDKNEKISVKLKGSFGEAFILTDKRVYVLKWGFMAGNLIGGRCNAFDFHRIIGLEIKKEFGGGILEVLTAANQNTQKSCWGTGENDAIKSDNVIVFNWDKSDLFQEATRKVRKLLSESKSERESEVLYYTELEKLAELKEKGIITEEEFNLKKRQILGL